MSVLTVSFSVTKADDPIRVYMGGSGQDIPIIQLGETRSVAQINVHPDLLAQAQQVAWLQRLAAQVVDLAEQVAAQGAES